MSQTAEWHEREIYQRADGSYIIHMPHPYHVPNEGEWAELWAAVTAYLDENGITPEPEPLPPPPPPPTQEELAEQIRAQRNQLLAASDYIMVSDYPISAAEREAWAAYRQALRDITAQEGFPENVVWPVSPDGQAAAQGE